MSEKYIAKEVAKIVGNKQLAFPLNMALASAWILANFKGINLKIIDMQKTSSLADYHILSSTENPTTARAMAESLRFHLKRHDLPVCSTEGVEQAQWILLDCGDIIIHIFQEATRDVFDLDELWQQHLTVPIPQDYYFANPEVVTEQASGDEYF